VLELEGVSWGCNLVVAVHRYIGLCCDTAQMVIYWQYSQ